VPNGVDRQLFRPRNRSDARKELALPENTKILLFVGRLEKEKGLEELGRAYRDLLEKSQEPISLVLLGEGSFQESLARQVKDLKNVLFLGARPPREVASYLAASNLLVLPSWAEGTPNVVLEALASGRPVVATHVGGIPDVVRPDRTGLLVAPKDASALAITLHTALHRSWSEEEIVATAPPAWEESGALLYEVLKNAWIHSHADSAVA
jgi:teichuronic acid biosynthesis glycosyltransferase TuaC